MKIAGWFMAGAGGSLIGHAFAVEQPGLMIAGAMLFLAGLIYGIENRPDA